MGTSGAIPRFAIVQAEFFVSESFLAELSDAPDHILVKDENG